ncbi:hypothetical protein D3C78_20590 [compost metagenome]
MLKLAPRQGGVTMLPVDLHYSKRIENGRLPKHIEQQIQDEFPEWEYKIGSNWIVYKKHDRFIVEVDGFMQTHDSYKEQYIALSGFFKIESLSHHIKQSMSTKIVINRYGRITIPQNYCHWYAFIFNEIITQSNDKYVINTLFVIAYDRVAKYVQYTYRLVNGQVIIETNELPIPEWFNTKLIQKSAPTIDSPITADEILYKSDNLVVLDNRCFAYGKVGDYWEIINNKNLGDFSQEIQNEYMMFCQFSGD